MNKKGFTVVELALVIIVIGIILLMTIYGNSLFKSARYKAEIVKMQKFQNAINQYNAQNPDSIIYSDKYIENSGSISKINIQEAFIDSGMLDSEIVQNTIEDEDTVWNLIICRPGDETITYDKKGHNVCASSYSAENGYKMSAIMACLMESNLDDKSLTTGDGRVVDTADSTTITSGDFSKCLLIKDNIYITYTYKLN